MTTVSGDTPDPSASNLLPENPDAAPDAVPETGSGAVADAGDDLASAGPRSPRLLPGWLWACVVGGLVLAAGMLVGGMVRLPYYRISPGPSERTAPMVSVTGAPTFSHVNQLFLTTVSVSPLTPLQWVAAKLDGKDDIVDKKAMDGDKSTKDVDRLNAEMMSQSKLVATKVALEKLGYPVSLASDGTIIAAVAKDAPAATQLQAGEVVRTIDAKPVTSAAEVVAALAGKKPGDNVTLGVEKDPKLTTITSVTVPMVAAPPGAPNPAVIGVSLRPYKLRIVSPVTVTITTNGIGGPSAGLAYTLQIMQTMTKTDIVSARRVAATGEMEPDGTVGEIGGVDQKVRSVERAGASVFLVPKGNYEEAKKAATTVRVVPVGTIDDALAAARSAG